MKVGFTGTRNGMNDAQKNKVALMLHLISLRHAGENEFHHGDCVGADAEAAAMARKMGFTIIGHPPTQRIFRAWFDSDKLFEPKTYLERNREIVACSNFMIATPKDVSGRGGTWHTIHFSEKKSVKIAVLMTSGDVMKGRFDPIPMGRKEGMTLHHPASGAAAVEMSMTGTLRPSCVTLCDWTDGCGKVTHVRSSDFIAVALTLSRGLGVYLCGSCGQRAVHPLLSSEFVFLPTIE